MITDGVLNSAVTILGTTKAISFDDKVLTYFDIGSLRFVITESILSMWLIMAVLIIFAVIVRMRLKNFKDEPSGFQNFVEMLVEGLDSFVGSTMGERHRRFTPYFGSLFLLILLSNLSGLFGLRPPTANYSVPLGLALITFFMTQYFGITSKGVKEYGKGFLEPMAPFVVLNVVGEIANPFSLSFRLFGNIVGGTILMGLYYAMLPWFLQIGIPSFLHAYLDVFAGVLQAFVFTMLSMIFVSGAFADE
ncbi:ATP synthase F0 subunit A [Clostridiales bacterium COT073_COT-073]|nr:ATP synthase F0 subunit A [Clostridiales bacterium COT073_COT-073]